MLAHHWSVFTGIFNGLHVKKIETLCSLMYCKSLMYIVKFILTNIKYNLTNSSVESINVYNSQYQKKKEVQTFLKPD